MSSADHPPAGAAPKALFVLGVCAVAVGRVVERRNGRPPRRLELDE